LITAFGNITKRIKGQAFIEFEIDGVSYELVFMIAPNLASDVILRITFLKENNVVINLTEGSFKTPRDGFNCEHKFICDSFSKNKVGKWELALYQTRIQPKFSELQSTTQQNGKGYTVSAQTAHAFMPVLN